MTEFTKEQFSAAEAILYAVGGAVPLSSFAYALEIPEEDAEALLTALQARYEDACGGIQIIRLERSFQMCTRRDYYPQLVRIVAEPVKPVMTQVMLEVLSIVAYKQPVTRGEIEKIRGVSSDYAVNRLIEFGLIEEAGRLEAPGRPILFRTTESFLRYFGLTSVSELPSFDDLTQSALAEIYRNTGTQPDGQVSVEV
ncbi:MAG: SMC-Scp complex subunit ScpB [Lachnospiraceae bacterium]|nr:SMC-Scp complex subunit ScpB [Lachnospiraceae bacterium]